MGLAFDYMETECLYKVCFYNAEFISSNSEPFTIQGNVITRENLVLDNVDFSGNLLATWTSWQFEQHGSLGPLDLLREPLDS